MIPYSKQYIDEEDIKAVEEVLRSDWLTTGPKVAEFEKAVADYVGVKYAVAVSSGTAALHCAMDALDIGPGDEVIVPPITFAATANCVVFQGGTPVFVDVHPETLLIEPDEIERSITDKTKAVIAVDYAGHPCDYDRLKAITQKYDLALIDDACHALGAEYKGRRVGSLADITVFSFHPVKHITTGEGGMITTDDEHRATRMRIFRNHGITTDHHQREKQGSWIYEMVALGFNYRITDFQCALGISQLKKISIFLDRRREIARCYDKAFARIQEITPLKVSLDVQHAYHLYVIKIDFNALGINRSKLFQSLREKGIGVNVHYIPVHFHSFYREKFRTTNDLCPVAENTYEQVLSLPMYSGMNDKETNRVIEEIINIIDTCE